MFLKMILGSLLQADGGTMQVASAGTDVGDDGAEGVDPRGLLAFSRIVEKPVQNIVNRAVT